MVCFLGKRVAIGACFSKLGKRSYSKSIYDNIFFMNFLTIPVYSFLLLIVNQRTKHFTEVQWYYNVGSEIIMTALLLGCKPFLRIAMVFGGRLIKCTARGCTCDSRHTKKLTQEDYLEENKGMEFELDDRYNDMLTMIYLVVIYAGGLPLLYPIAAMFFLLTYITDKCLLFNEYQRPLRFDGYVAKKSLEWLKWVVFFRIIMSSALYLRENMFEDVVSPISALVLYLFLVTFLFFVWVWSGKYIK